MKKFLYCACFACCAAAAFADGDDNATVLVSTKGSDRYLNGEVVLDGECYALVWSSDGVFEGFSADVSAAVPADGGAQDVKIEVPAAGESGFYKVIHN